MKQTVARLLGLLLSASMARAVTPTPQDFAFAVPVIITKDAAAYRFALPLSVYQNTYRDDIADIQMFNAAGDAVPFSLLRQATPSPIHRVAQPLPIFPLHEGSPVVLDGVRVTIDSPGSAIKLQTQNGTAVDAAVYQYILDARALNVRISGLQLGWPESSSDYSGRMRVEASNDLGSWRTVVTASPIANLHANGQVLIENRIPLTETAAKFWRLSWIGAAPAFELISVLAEPAEGFVEPARTALDVIGTPDPANSDRYTFDLGAHPPITRVNVLLPEANTVVNIELSSRRTPEEPWKPVAHAGFYRLKGVDGDQYNVPLELPTNHDRYWRVRMLGDAPLPHAPLQLHVEWVPNELTFLARGPGPFLLACGSSTATSAQTDLAQLPDKLQIAPATLGPSQVLGGPGRLTPKPAAFPWIRAVLWSVLFLAVILLASMAYKLSRQTSHPADTIS